MCLSQTKHSEGKKGMVVIMANESKKDFNATMRNNKYMPKIQVVKDFEKSLIEL